MGGRVPISQSLWASLSTSGSFCARMLWEANGTRLLQEPNTRLAPSNCYFHQFFSNSTTWKEQVSLPVKFKIRQMGKWGGKHNRSLCLQIHLAAYLLSGVAFSLYFQTSLVKQVYRGAYPRNTSHCSSAPSQTFSGSVRMPHDQTGSINNSHYGKLDTR